jgi:hypothetical protein
VIGSAQYGVFDWRCGLIALALTILCGCVPAPYRALHTNLWDIATDGYEDTQIDSNTFRISYLGQSGVLQTTADLYGMFRCAELTVEKGYDYFVVLEESSNKDINTNASNSLSTHTDPPGRSGAPAITTVRSTTTVSTSSQYSTVRQIKVYRGSKPEENPHAYNAREVMSYLEPKIKKK